MANAFVSSVLLAHIVLALSPLITDVTSCAVSRCGKVLEYRRCCLSNFEYMYLNT